MIHHAPHPRRRIAVVRLEGLPDDPAGTTQPAPLLTCPPCPMWLSWVAIGSGIVTAWALYDRLQSVARKTT